MVNWRNGPNCASIGFDHEALVGVRHSSTLLRTHQVRIAGVVLVERLSQMTWIGAPSGRLTDRFERGQGVFAAFVFVQDTPQPVYGDVSVGDAAGTTARPMRVQTGQPLSIERVDHIPHRALIRGHQPSDRRHHGARRRSPDDQRATHSDRLVLTPPYQA